MEVKIPLSVISEIRIPSDVGEARRRAASMAQLVGLDDVRAGNVSIIVMELATNLLRHAVKGQITLQSIVTEYGDAVEILSMDQGPGMASVNRCLQDGYSTGSTPGNGLGAVRRLSSEFDIYSVPSQGTVIVSRVRRCDGKIRSSESFVSWGAYSKPIPGETVCGDSWAVAAGSESASFVVCDGLGHGPLAAEAAASIIAAFAENPSYEPDRFLDAAHRKASGSRGAAVAIAKMHANGELKYAGIGNISGILFEGNSTRSMVSHNGTVGVRMRKTQTFDYTLASGGILVMFSDGLQSRWSFQSYPDLQFRHPSIVAAVLGRDFMRGRDDVTVLVAKPAVLRRAQ